MLGLKVSYMLLMAEPITVLRNNAMLFQYSAELKVVSTYE